MHPSLRQRRVVGRRVACGRGDRAPVGREATEDVVGEEVIGVIDQFLVAGEVLEERRCSVVALGDVEGVART